MDRIRLVRTQNVRNYVHERLLVAETRHGVRDVAVNVRGAAVRVSSKQFTHAKIVG